MRAPVRASVPPPPPASRKKQDATQALDINQIVEMAPTATRSSSVRPPLPPSATVRSDATQVVDIGQVLEVATKPAHPPLSTPPAPPVTRSTRPSKSPDYTQPVRLDQVLEVAAALKQGPTPPHAEMVSAQVAPTTPDPTAELVEIVDTLAPQAPEPSAQPSDGMASTSASPSTATLLEVSPTSREDAAASAPPHAPRPDNTPAVAKGSTANDSLHPEPLLAATRPRSTANADTERVVTGDVDIGTLIPSNQRLIYAAAAVVLLGIGLGAHAMFGRGTGDVASEKAKAAEVRSEPKPAALSASDTSQGTLPLAEVPKAPERAAPPAPVEATPEPAPAQAAPEPVRADPAIERSNTSAAPEPPAASREATRENQRDLHERGKSEGRSSQPNKMALWTAARDEARAHYAAKRYRQAADAYERAAKYNPAHAGTLAGLGAARLQIGDARGAVRAYQRAIQISPSTSGFHAALGRAYVLAGDKSRARAAYKKALALDPNNGGAKQALAELGR